MPSTTSALPTRPIAPRAVGAFSILGLLIRQTFGRRGLERRPEPEGVMDNDESVSEYTQVMETKLAISYAVGWETIHRVRQWVRLGLAVDFCSGPGVFSVGLVEILGYQRVIGLDLAPGMVDAARRNASDRGHDGRIGFTLTDVTQRSQVADNAADLTTFFDAAHHMPDLDAVRAVVAEMERITHPRGLIVTLDLARLANAALTERYVNAIGSDYRQLGLEHFLEDFRHSMYAAWTVDELAGAIPPNTSRCWVQLVPRGLPALQLLIGLPVGRQRLFLRGPKQPAIAEHIPESFHGNLKMIQRLLRFGRKRVLASAR